MFHRNREAAERMARRQQSEDDAPRLTSEVPRLRTLKLSLSFRRGSVSLVESAHRRVVIVPRAPALFWVACADRECREGGHEITDSVMRALRSGETHFSGEEPCQGTLGAAESQCNGVLVYEAEATYG